MITGCPPRQAFDPNGDISDVVPMQLAVDRINDNLQRIHAPMNARGRVTGYVTMDNGQRRHFNLAAHLFYLQPRYLSLDLKDDLAGSQLLFGSNQTRYWMHNKQQDDTYWCRRYDRLIDGLDPELPINPIELIDAMGFNPIIWIDADPYHLPSQRSVTQLQQPIQRIVDEHQQLIFVTHATNGDAILKKEYWVSRRPPYLVSRILYRDAWGDIAYESNLSAYASIEDDGPLMPHHIEIRWPKSDVRMEFSISRWRILPTLKPDAIQFTPPHIRGVRFDNMYVDQP